MAFFVRVRSLFNYLRERHGNVLQYEIVLGLIKHRLFIKKNEIIYYNYMLS